MAIRHGTLVANTATSVSLPRDLREVAVMHKASATNPIYVRCDGTPATIGGNDTYTVLPGQHRTIPRLWSKGAPTVVSLICAAAVDYEVEFP
jgi:hypothetical protein